MPERSSIEMHEPGAASRRGIHVAPLAHREEFSWSRRSPCEVHGRGVGLLRVNRSDNAGQRPHWPGTSSASFIDVLDRVLDKGVVVDAAMRFSLAGIDIITVDAHVVIASFDTYLTHARDMKR